MKNTDSFSRTNQIHTHDDGENVAELKTIIKNQALELADMGKRLNAANNELEQFALIANHDLQEPLRKIKSFTSILAESTPEWSEKNKSYLDKIISASDRMSALVKSILSFSKLISPQHELVETDLNLVFKNIVNDFHDEIQNIKATIKIDDLPTIKAVPLQMHLLFSNLISNALKFAKKDTTLIINISASTPLPAELSSLNLKTEEVSFCKILISDTGVGFNQRFATDAFKMFKRLHDRTYPGTGIGLTLCKKIVHNHSGEIYANSQEASGTQLHVILPHNASTK
jgi:light-regulated signal transduction histidine kinase (bacteriophytochrome)